MTSERMLPAMDYHHFNENHEQQYFMAQTRFPTENSINEFELFQCVYDPGHKVNSKTWRTHLRKCRNNYGGRMMRCDFNAEHEFPEPEREWHIMTCPDKHVITQEFQSARRMATEVNHNPQWQAPETDENWDDEIEEDPGQAFSLDHRKSMPIHLLPRQQEEPEHEEEEYYYDEQEEGEYYDDDGAVAQQQQQQRSVLEQELLPEKPANWESMSKTQRKNYKRKYTAQRQRMEEEGVTEEDFAPVKDPKLWTEEIRNARLNAIKAKFPLAPEKQHAARFDYASLLNIVCQKCRIHLPEWRECPGEYGGFAYTCRIGQNWYKGVDFCTTKKDAKHECAKWALLSMDIPGVDTEDNVGTNRFKGSAPPVHPRLAAADLQKAREADEVGKLMAANMYPAPKNTTPLRQPRLQKSPTNSPSKQQQQQPYIPPQQETRHVAPPQQPRGWGQQQQQPRGWGQQQPPQRQPTNPPPGFQSNGPSSRPVTQSTALPSSSLSSSGPGGWGQRSSHGAATAPSQPIVNGMQNMSLQNGNEEFPALGGGGVSNGWSSAGKKGKSKGVQNPPRGRGRGRGRGTTMKQ